MLVFMQPGRGIVPVRGIPNNTVMGTVIFLMIGLAMLLTIPEKKRT